MKKIFIDCGGHVGESIKLFKKSKDYTSDFMFYSFEPVPYLFEKYKEEKDIIKFKQAVWIFDGEVNLYLAEHSDGNSLFKGKKTGNMNKEHPIKVQCIDLSKWIQNTFNKNDYIILKMNIEGAEFKILDKMIKDKTIEYINKSYIGWHFAIDFKDKKMYEKLLIKLKSSNTEIFSEMKKCLKRR